MANHHRGEIDCVIGGRSLKLCLTLGALADIESGLGVDGLAALGERLASGRLATRDLMTIIAAAARGAGESVTTDELSALPLGRDVAPLIGAVARLLQFAFGADEAAPNPR